MTRTKMTFNKYQRQISTLKDLLKSKGLSVQTRQMLESDLATYEKAIEIILTETGGVIV